MSNVESRKIWTQEEVDLALNMHGLWVASEGETGSKADFTKADLGGLKLMGRTLTGVSFAGAHIGYAEFSGSRLDACDFTEVIGSGVIMKSCKLHGTKFVSAGLRSADFTGAEGAYTDFSGADMALASFREARLTLPRFVGADMGGTNLTDATFLSPDFTGADLRWVVGDSRFVQSLQCGDRWAISYTHDTLNIGCQSHAIEQWWAFDDEAINAMDRNAWVWWQVWKPLLQQIIAASPAKRYKAIDTGE